MRLTGLLLLLLSAFSANASAQGADGATPNAPIKGGDLTITGSVRLRLYGWNWFDPASGNNTYTYSGNILRVNLSQTRQSWQWDAEFAAPFMLGLPKDATGTGPQQGPLGLGANYFAANDGRRNPAMIFPRQLYIQFGGADKSCLKLGRFTFLDGAELAPKNATLAALKRERVSQRLIGDFGFSDVGRSFDGAHYSYSSHPSDNFTIVAGVPTRGVFQVDGWGWNKTGFGYAAYTRDWGAGRHAADTRVFIIEYDDWRHVLKTDNRAPAVRAQDAGNILLTTFGGHTIHAIQNGAGTVSLMFWGVAQTGRWGSQKQRSGSVDAEGGFQPKILPALKPWVRGGYTWSSGDGDPNDGAHGTFFQLLPTPRPYARFPFYNMMNVEDAFGAVILQPGDKITASSEFHSLRLTSAADLWYSGGGVFQPWTFGYSGRSTSSRRSLANVYDASIEYRMTSAFTLTGYFGYAQGLASIEHIYPRGKDGTFGYVEGLYRF